MGTWIEMFSTTFPPLRLCPSFPAMGTWIEMNRPKNGLRVQIVVPCNGNVDWNTWIFLVFTGSSVVPCNGNVDWNNPCLQALHHPLVVPCNGNVDWNNTSPGAQGIGSAMSFPAMGTWIEILTVQLPSGRKLCRSLQWERGLKFDPFQARPILVWRSRSLQWERGLK